MNFADHMDRFKAQVLDTLSLAADFLVRSWPPRRTAAAPGSPYALLREVCAAIRPELLDLYECDADGRAAVVIAPTFAAGFQSTARGAPDHAVRGRSPILTRRHDPAVLLTLAQHGRGTLSMDKTAAVRRHGELMKSDAFKRGDREAVTEIRTLAPIVSGKGLSS